MPRLWHKTYSAICACIAIVMILIYSTVLHRPDEMVHTASDYVSFMALLGSLFLASGGIVLDIRCRPSPTVNLALLLGGAVLANVIGTIGASLLLIRPYLRLNAGRLRPYHAVFFIFMVANVGGALTPIGDPPLFLGYLRGIGFFRFFTLDVEGWALALGCLAVVFWWCDARNERRPLAVQQSRFRIDGAAGLWAIAVIIAAVFLDPTALPWLPALTLDLNGHSERISFVRETVQIAAGLMAWRAAKPQHLLANDFNFEPIAEIAFLFLGIFATMMPALDLIRLQAEHGALAGIPMEGSVLYFGTGTLSSLLDNAPTFLAFLSGLSGKTGLDAAALGRSSDPAIARDLAACAMGAVFWGGMSYLGNGPNFMIRAICMQARGVDGRPAMEVPGFFGYMLRYAVPILLPILILVWFIVLR